MATFLSTPRSAASGATPGERRVADRLEQLLEDDYLCWYDVPVGPRYQHPDFVVLHPARGILVLEVKDWKLEQIREMNPVSFTMDFGAGLKVQPNPLDQVRGYAHAIVRVLEQDSQLLHGPESPYAGRLCFPFGYGVVLTGITRRQFESQELGIVLPAHLVICKDEMTESAEAEAFQRRLWDMFNVSFRSLLTLPQVDRIRARLFPELRISQRPLDLEATPDELDLRGDADELHVMDLQQEAIARGLGDGHRIIHGVAGSGKTLILAYRCQHLARSMEKPILVLVYNRTLASWLRQQILERGIAERVSVRTFHSWCHDQLRLYHVPLPEEGAHFYQDLVAAVTGAVDRGQIPRAQYGAVLIDEGHDFEADWLSLVVQMVDPHTNSLLLLYDDAQSIYGQRKSAGFSFRSVGISAAGRTKILRRNYRNTDEILACAREFAHDILVASEIVEEDSVPSLMPELGGRHGCMPRFGQFGNVQAEARGIAVEVRRLHNAGTAWGEIAVLYTAPFIGEAVKEALAGEGVPATSLKDSPSRDFQPGLDSVKLMTAHSSKGLQYRAVIVAGVGYLPYRAENDDARLMYVALTRATHELVVTTSKSSSFSERLRNLCAPLSA